jgi:hypothetical protein
MEIHGLVKIQRAYNFMLNHLPRVFLLQNGMMMHQVSMIHGQSQVFDASQNKIVGHQVPFSNHNHQICSMFHAEITVTYFQALLVFEVFKSSANWIRKV